MPVPLLMSGFDSAFDVELSPPSVSAFAGRLELLVLARLGQASRCDKIESTSLNNYSIVWESLTSVTFET